MTELLLICIVGALGVGFATNVRRWLLRRPFGDDEFIRISLLVNHGVTRFLKRQNVVVVALASVVAATVLLAYGIAYQTDVISVESPREHGMWMTGAYALGVIFAMIANWVAGWSGRKACGIVANTTRRSLDEPLQIAIRAGGISGVTALALALLGLAGLFLALYFYHGGFDEQGSGLAMAPRMPLLMSGFALGSAVVALLGQLGGGVFSNVADVGADVAGKLGASLPEDAPSNPAVIADLVGDTVGDLSARAGSVFAAAVTELLGAMMIASLVYQDNKDLPSVTAIVLFPLVARVFSLIAAWFGVMVVRTDDREVPMNALSRGLYVSSLLHTVAAVGCAKWLLGPHWMAFAGCIVLGGAAGIAFLHVFQYFSEQKYRPVRDLAEAARGGATLAVLRGLLTAIEGGLVLLILVLVAGGGAFYLGASTGLVSGGLFGLAVAVTGMFGSAPYVLAMDGMGSIVDTAGGIVEMTVAPERPDVRARARVLDAVGSTSKGFSRALMAISSGAGCFMLLTAFTREVCHSGTPPKLQIDVMNPALYVGGALGLLIVLVFMAVTLSRIVQAGRGLVNDIRVQLDSASERSQPAGAEHDSSERLESEEGGERQSRSDRNSTDRIGGRSGSSDVSLGGQDGHQRGYGEGATREPRDPYRPSFISDAGERFGKEMSNDYNSKDDPYGYLPFVEVVSRIALRGMVPLVVVGIGVPLLIAVALRLLATGDNVAPSAEALVALLLVATIAGAVGSLLFTSAGSAWDNAKKYIETGAHGGRYVVAGRNGEVDNPTYVAAVIGDTIGDPLKGAVGPATQALVKTLSTLALVFLPFFL